MIILIRNEQLWAFKISGTHPNIVVFFWQIELSQAPVDYAQFFCLVVYDNILGLDIPVHDSY